MQYYILDISALLCAVVCLHLLRVWCKSGRASLPLPPGPKGLPLIGNLLDISEVVMWEAAGRWGEKYGPLVHVKSLGMSYIFLNSYQTAVDLFEKRGSNYSSRPRIPMADLEGWDWFVTMLPYGDELRSARRMLHRFFQPASVSEYDDLQMRSAYKLLEGLLASPDNYVQLLRQSIGESILMIAYGYRALSDSDSYILLIEQCLNCMAESLGFSIVNAFPLLLHLPGQFLGARFQKAVRKGRELSTWMAREPYKMSKEIMFDGTATPSMTSKLANAAMTEDGIIKDEALIAKVTGVSYAAGADTSVSSLHTFLLAMLLYPEVQQRAQAELDQVVGKDVLPSLSDRPRLPYIEAIVKEIFRWQPVAPLAVAHIVDEDDEYKGYLIPAGAIIFSNTWAILRNPEEYPEPEKFIPERWLPSEGKKQPLDVYKVAFGIGRRVCPGLHFASNTVFIYAASILSAFNITKPLGEDGMPITPSGQYTNLSTRHPEPFKYVLTPRSDKTESVIRETVESAK